MIERTAIPIIGEIIEQLSKMAFVSGPRQVGKTTLAKRYLEQFGQGLYRNWDVPPHQKEILTDPLFFEKQNRNPEIPFLVIFDEIPKYARWKNYLKGVFDHGQRPIGSVQKGRRQPAGEIFQRAAPTFDFG
jgi:uncharacterized protein